MPSKKWSGLNHMQLGQFGEYYAKMEFASYGFDVYTSEVDDHGVDFIARDIKTGIFYEVQVKSMFKGKYVFIKKDKLVMDDRHLVCFLHFIENELPEIYVIPATAWETPNAVLVDRNYVKPEWGINFSNKNQALLEKYDQNVFSKIVTVQSQAKFHKPDVKCEAFWRLALNSYRKLNNV